MADFFYNSDFDYAYLGETLVKSEPMPQTDFYAQKDIELNQLAYMNQWIQETALSLPEPSHCSKVKTAKSVQYPGHLDMPVNRMPMLYSWPTEYFITPAGAEPEFMPATFGLSSPAPSTPELSSTSSSAGNADETLNVFDMQFGSAFSRSSPLTHSEAPSPASSSSSHTPDAYEYARPPSVIPPSEASDRRRFPCQFAGCSRRFISQYTLKVHTSSHAKKPKVYFTCTEGCSERFSRQHDRLRHEVAKHSKICEFSCNACGRFFSTSKTLGNHKCPAVQKGPRWVHS